MSWITRSQIEAIQQFQLTKHGGLPGLRDEALLEAAIAAPLATFGGQRLYPTLPERAARLAFGLVANHPFNDGNKRVGVMAMLVVLETNGYLLTATNEQVIELGLSLADGSYTYDDCLTWVKEHSQFNPER